MNTLCKISYAGSIPINFKMNGLNLQLEKFSTNDKILSRSMIYSGDEKSRVNVKINEIIYDGLRQNYFTQSSGFCVQTTYYKVNLRPLNKE